MIVNWKQVVASVSGAVIAAFALSYLGVGGTILGVALGSAAATIGSSVAFRSIEKGHEKVKGLVSTDPTTAQPTTAPVRTRSACSTSRCPSPAAAADLSDQKAGSLAHNRRDRAGVRNLSGRGDGHRAHCRKTIEHGGETFESRQRLNVGWRNFRR